MPEGGTAIDRTDEFIAAPLAAPAACRYRVHGLDIDVDRPVPRLTPAPSTGDPVFLRIAPVPLALAQAESSDAYFQANGSEYLFRQPKRWAALVREGRFASFEALAPLSDELFWYIAVSNAAGVAGYQRGMFPLHGSSILFAQGGVAFTGPSGAGKTTLTAGLVSRGLPLVSDDLCLIRPEGAAFMTGGGAPELRLLRDAADALGWDQDQSIGHQSGRDKFAFVHTQASVGDVPVRAVVELVFSSGPPRLERLQGVEPFRAFVGAIRLRMGLHLFPHSQRTQAFELVSRMARNIPVYRFTRPREFATFEAGADLFIKEFGA